jgi:hypothetical protein
MAMYQYSQIKSHFRRSGTLCVLETTRVELQSAAMYSQWNLVARFTRILKEGQHVSEREVCVYLQGEQYKLFWSESPEFVRTAIRHGATIIPFSSVGGDDIFEVRQFS